MKIKYIHIYIYFILSMSAFSQSGEVIYEAETQKKDLNTLVSRDSTSVSQKKHLSIIYNEQPKVFYALDFNKDESIFKKQESMNTQKRRLNLLKEGWVKVLITPI